MDAEMRAQATQYEQLTQTVYQAILRREGIINVNVEHNVDVKGRSGVAHQVDVLWRFRQAGLEHLVLIECKNYATPLTLEKVRNFFAVCHDIGNARGIMVTKTGFQSGTVEFGKHYGIELKLLRKPTEEDWKGRIKDIHLNITAKTAVSTEEKPLVVQVQLAPSSEEQADRMVALQARGLGRLAYRPDACLLDKDRLPISDEFRWYIPQQLEVLDKDDGGPYTQRIELKDAYMLMDEGQPTEELVRVAALECTFYVESISQEIISHGENLVEAILKDFNTQSVEYIHTPKLS